MGTVTFVEKARGSGTALIHVERVQLVDGPGENRLRMDLKSSYYLGERWEYLLELDGLKLRVWGKGPMARERQWVALPADGLWIF